MTKRYPRDLIGYGRTPPDPQWPNPSGEGHARICVQFVVNYEEGGESSILDGDPASESLLSEIVGAQPWPGQRNLNMESLYEYGSRAGFWRLWRMFTERDMPVTVYGVALALQRNPEAVEAMLEADWEIASHGLRWLEYKDFSEEEERRHILDAVRIHTAVTGSRPLGIYQGKPSANTLKLVMEEGGFAYSSDSYADDLPSWVEGPHGPHLIIPYTLDTNDMRFATPQGFNSGDQFFAYLKDAFDALYAEGEAGRAKLLNVGLHCRLVGRPGRAAALARFLDYVKSKPDVWVARRIDIANHWREHFPYTPRFRPSRMKKAEFVETFGGVFEHSPFVAKRAFKSGLADAHDTPAGLSRAMNAVFREAGEAERLEVLKAHPDLAGRLALAGDLTEQSKAEQAGAGLDRLTPDELADFTELNRRFVERFGFPFIIAVKGLDKTAILAAFERRVDNEPTEEFATACREVEKIARLRIHSIFEGRNS
ncbi:allantoinase PuuE [Jiella pacifica]|uniref:Chitooligosaccharide deacetylase n=1 Tax=Jiella pacifica TaxID=2696469 RepID=A0A6N9T8G4_9HYPH|nr:allantoinase PuuE [Jiella pacifica]NDW05188.1 allantoinase PuuE [Jiella pacifica]